MLKKDAHVPCASCSNFNAHSAQIYLTKHNGVGALGALGLLLDGDGPALAVELHDAEALGSSTW